MARSLLRQLEQVSGSFAYDDTLPMAIAETANDLTLEKDLNFLRSQAKAITGKTNWFDAPEKTIDQLDTEDDYENTFMGKAYGNDLPAYSSQIYITNGDNLETAIGELDAAIAGVSETKVIEDIVAAITAETAHTLPHGKTYTLDSTGEGANLDVFVNGQFLAVDSGSVDRDYEETSTTQVTFHFTVEENSNLVYAIR